MKIFANLLLAAVAVQAHCMLILNDIPARRRLTFADTFPRLVINGKAEEKDWSVTRMTKNAQSKQGIENPTNADIRCYQSRNAGDVATVPAGATVHYISTQQINHPGPTQYYLAKVPPGMTVATWDGSGAVWFKFHTEMPMMDKSKQLTWPGQSKD
jgi:hypothetical protein